MRKHYKNFGLDEPRTYYIEWSQKEKNEYCILTHIYGIWKWYWWTYLQGSSGDTWGFPGGWDSKESICNAGDLVSIPRLGRSPGEGQGNPLQYSCLENPHREAWWATVHGVSKSWTRLSDPAKWRHRHGEKTYGHRAGGEEGEGGMYGEKHEAYTLSYIK